VSNILKLLKGHENYPGLRNLHYVAETFLKN